MVGLATRTCGGGVVTYAKAHGNTPVFYTLILSNCLLGRDKKYIKSVSSKGERFVHYEILGTGGVVYYTVVRRTKTDEGVCQRPRAHETSRIH